MRTQSYRIQDITYFNVTNWGTLWTDVHAKTSCFVLFLKTCFFFNFDLVNWELLSTFMIILFFMLLLTFTNFLAYLADDKLTTVFSFFSLFFQKTGFDISCKFSPKETACMKDQILLCFYFFWCHLTHSGCFENRIPFKPVLWGHIQPRKLRSCMCSDYIILVSE